MWQVLSKIHNLDGRRTCMIGDRLDTDIAFAAHNSIGFSIAVLSGITNEEEIKKYAETIDTSEKNDHDRGAHLCPDYYATCLGDLFKFL